MKDNLDSVDRIQNQTSLKVEIEVVEETLEENEIEQGLSTPPTTDSDATVSHYGDEEEVDNDGLDDTMGTNRFTQTGTFLYINHGYRNTTKTTTTSNSCIFLII